LEILEKSLDLQKSAPVISNIPTYFPQKLLL